MTTKILLVDDSTMRQPFVYELLRDTGTVTGFQGQAAALKALKGGLSADVAVLHYRGLMGPLINAIRRSSPHVKIVAYGNPRLDTPLGVDQYFKKPILGAQLREAVEREIRG